MRRWWWLSSGPEWGLQVVKAVDRSGRLPAASAGIDTTPGKEGADVGNMELGLGELEVADSAPTWEGTSVKASQAVSPEPLGSAGWISPIQRVYKHTVPRSHYGVHPVIGTTGPQAEQLAGSGRFGGEGRDRRRIIRTFSVGNGAASSRPRAAARFYDIRPNSPLLHHKQGRRPQRHLLKRHELMRRSAKASMPPRWKEHERWRACRRRAAREAAALNSIGCRAWWPTRKWMFGAAGETYVP